MSAPAKVRQADVTRVGVLDLARPETWPLRMTTEEVLQVGRFKATTLWRRRRADPSWLPASTVQGGKSTLFDRSAVLKALGLVADGARDAPPEQQGENPWKVDFDAIREARARKVRHGKAAARQAAEKGRDTASLVRGAPQAPALRLVASDSASGKR
jgi:hypothetical protein